MARNVKQAVKPKAYQMWLQSADSVRFDQIAKQKGLAGATLLRMLAKKEIEQYFPSDNPIQP